MNKKVIIGILLICFLVIPSIYFFYTQYQKMSEEYKKTQILLNKSSANIDEEALSREVINKVGKLMELPNEIPTIASITDKTRLQDQPFFDRSQNGDKVLIFQNSKKAIIYRESINKIIEVGSINIGDVPTPSPTLSPTPAKSVKKSPTPKVSPTP